MRVLKIVIALFVVFYSVVTLSSTNEFDCKIDERAYLIGQARTLEGEPLYCEYYYHADEQQERVRVVYRDMQQAIIVEKQLDFSTGQHSPSVDQKDKRHQEWRVVEVSDGGPIGIVYRAPNEEAVKRSQIEKKAKQDHLVVDAGFNRAIQTYWSTLTADQKPVRFDFVSPVHARVIGLKVRRVVSDQCNKPTGETGHCFLVKPASTLLSWFVKPLRLWYNDDKQLKQFQGTVNVTNVAGESQNATIAYWYPPF